MSLNPKYVIASGLDEYFVDKDTGLPLSGGRLEFFKDNNRAVSKDVFIISGTAPNYSYTNIGSVVTLNAVGNPQYNNDNIVIYYYPYDEDGNLELYFVQCFSSENVEQFTREAWPNTSADVPAQQELSLTNYVPNGQFLAHNNIPENVITNTPANRITAPTTIIAPGGWEFVRPSGSTSMDNVEFVRYGEYVPFPTASPRYYCRVLCTSPDVTDPFKTVQLIFDDVNKFASDTQQYTFSFAASASLSSSFQISLLLTKNFGTGGSPSPPITTLLDTFTILNAGQTFQTVFTFGTNQSYQLGLNNDDYVAIVFSLPTTISSGFAFTDVVLFPGNIDVSSFPQTTDRDFIARTMVSQPPDYNGYDLYLPLVQTKDGVSYDDSQVGMIFPLATDIVPVSHLVCDGQISYRTDAYSAEGIPYKRLQQKLLTATDVNNTAGMPVFGTGPQYVMATYLDDGVSGFLIITNELGAQAATADGAVPTAFTFNSICIGVGAAYGFQAYVYDSGNKLWIRNVSIGKISGTVSAGTSGFVINDEINSGTGERAGTPYAQQIISVTVNAFPTAGSYFQIATPTQQYYVWFTINGSGSDPAPGGIGIRVNLFSSMATTIMTPIVQSIVAAINGYQDSLVQVSQGSDIAGNSYFTFHANGQLYYVWYKLNGVGTDPALPGGIGIPVNYSAGYTGTQIRNATIVAINGMYFATPDLRWVSIKGWGAGTPLDDYNAAYRYSNNRYALPYYIGTYQFDMVLSHSHDILNYNLLPTNGVQVNFNVANYDSPLPPLGIKESQDVIEATGASQNDVKNIYMNYVIKY